jgi:hypothetical protein
MTNPTLHTPISTPSQRLAAAAALARKQKIAAAAHRDIPITCLSASVRSQTFAPPKERLFVERSYDSIPPLTITVWIDREIQSFERSRRVHIEDIQVAVAGYYDIEASDMKSARRSAEITKPRQIAMFLAKLLTPHSLPAIGRYFGRRDHTTVLHAVRKIEELIRTDEGLSREIDAIMRDLGRRFILPSLEETKT